MNAFLLDLVRSLGLAAVPVARERYVAPTGKDTANGQTPATPYATLERALQDAAGLPVNTRLRVHLAAGTYIGPFDLPSGVVLEGPETGPHPVLRAADTAVVRIGTLLGRTDDVHLERLVVTGGGRDPASKLGGGVVVRGAGSVTIADCVISDNQGYRGGGISVTGSHEVTILDSIIQGNAAGTQQTALDGARIVAQVISYPIGDGHGGGVYISDSSQVALTNCTIRANSAVLFGGGIAVVDTFASRPSTVEVRGNRIYCNETAHADAAPLGPLATACNRTPVADLVYDQLKGSLTIPSKVADVVNALHGVGWESGMGGGIALKNTGSGVRILGNTIGLATPALPGPNIARRGGGIACFTGSYPEITGNEIAHNLATDDGGGMAVDQFDPFLPPGEWTTKGFSRGPFLTRLWVTVADNDVHDNVAGGDGGGIYATGGVRLALRKLTGTPRVRNNRAGDNGGGIRVSYATQLFVADVAFENNTANANALVPGADPETTRSGGGGVAARNAAVTLERCSFTGNTAERFGGGGIYFVSCFEGGIGTFGFVTNEHGWFDQMQERIHGFHTRVLRLTDCTGQGNRATGASGAGAFLYVVRDRSVGGTEPEWTVISGAATRIGEGVSDYRRPTEVAGVTTIRKRGNAVIEISGKRIGGRPDGLFQDRLYVAPEVPADAFAPSRTTPGGENGPGLLIVIDNDESHNLVDPPRPYVLGPTPGLSEVSPVLVAPAGGTRVRLKGDRFEPGALVSLGGHPVSPQQLSATEIEVDSPPLPLGSHDVQVALGSGPLVVRAGGVRVVPDPVVTDVQPREGAAGTIVTITGTGFAPDAKIFAEWMDASVRRKQFLGVASRAGETELRTVMWPLDGGAGRVGLRVELPSGQWSSMSGAFTYVR